MLLLDWIEKNIDKFKDSRIGVLTGHGMGGSVPLNCCEVGMKWNDPFDGHDRLFGEDLVPYLNEIKELDEFKGIEEIKITLSPRVDIGDKFYPVNDIEVSSENNFNGEDRDLSFLFKNPDNEVLYIYGFQIDGLPKYLRLRYTFIKE